MTGRNPFAFIGEAELTIPMITPGQQLAEKLHAYARDYDDHRSMRQGIDAPELDPLLVRAFRGSLPA